MKIGIIGTGNMGRALGVRFAALGHPVFFGSRDASQGEEAARLAGDTASWGTNDAAAAFGDVLIWTIRDPDPRSVLANTGILDGKIVINLNNRDYARDVQEGAWFTEAIAEAFQKHAPKVKVVKALNLVAMESLDTSPELLRRAGAQLFIAGRDQDAKNAVGSLLQELGFEAVDAGTNSVAIRAVEALGDVIRLLMIGAGRGPLINLQLHPLPEPDLKTIGVRRASNYR